MAPRSPRGNPRIGGPYDPRNMVIRATTPEPAKRIGKMPAQEAPSPRVMQTPPRTEQAGHLPSAQELMRATAPRSPDAFPSAAELLGDWESLFPVDDGTKYYSPTSSSDPPRPRTREMSYNRAQQRLRVVYRDGGVYEYYGVPPDIWARVRQVRSVGRFLDKYVIGTNPAGHPTPNPLFPYLKVAD